MAAVRTHPFDCSSLLMLSCVGACAHPSAPATVDDAEAQLGRPAEEDDIQVETHPRSGKATKFYSYEDYSNQSSQPTPQHAHNGPPPNRQSNVMPWFPFQSRLDFELAEWMHDVRLNAKEMDRLLKIVQDIQGAPFGASGFNLASADHVRKLWGVASSSSDVAVSCRTSTRLR